MDSKHFSPFDSSPVLGRITRGLSPERHQPSAEAEQSKQFSPEDFYRVFIIRESRESDPYFTAEEKKQQEQFRQSLNPSFREMEWKSRQFLSSKKQEALLYYQKLKQEQQVPHYEFTSFVEKLTGDPNFFVKLEAAINESNFLVKADTLFEKPQYEEADRQIMQGLGLSQQTIKNLFQGEKKKHLFDSKRSALYKQAQGELSKVLNEKFAEFQGRTDILIDTLGQLIGQKLDVRSTQLPSQEVMESVQKYLPMLKETLSRFHKEAFYGNLESTGGKIKTVKERIDSRSKSLVEGAESDRSSLLRSFSEPFAHFDTLLAIAQRNDVFLSEESRVFVESLLEQSEDMLERQLAFVKPIQGDEEYYSQREKKYREKFAELRKLLKSRQSQMMQAGDPRIIRENIHNEYRQRLAQGTTPEEKAQAEKEAKLWLKEALALTKEYMQAQVDAFIDGFDKTLKALASYGDAKITNFTSKDVSSYFEKSKVTFSIYALHVTESFESMVESHNDVINVLYENADASLMDFRNPRKLREPREVFKAMTGHEPRGKVSIDMRPPLLAVRFICDSPKDFHLIAYGDDSVLSEAGGFSLGEHKVFVFSEQGNEKKFKAPVTVMDNDNGQRDRDILRRIIRHEDAHKMMQMKKGTEYLFADETRKDVAPVFIHSEVTNTLQEKWQKELNIQVARGVESARDEIQAYLADASTVDEIHDTLLSSELYTYVGTKDWVQKIKDQILNNVEIPLEVIQGLEEDRLKAEAIEAYKRKTIQPFEQDVQKAVQAYNKELAKLIEVTQGLVQVFKNKGLGPEKLAIFMRFFPAQDWVHLYRLSK